MKIKELIKVIINNKVYVKINDVLQLEELKVAGYKKSKAKEVLKPYATKIKGLGASLWLLEEDLENVNLIQKTISYEIFSDIKESVQGSNFALGLASLSFRDRLPEGWLEQEKAKIIDSAIEGQTNKEAKVIESIDKTIKEIADIEELNKKLADYNMEIKYEIRNEYRGFDIKSKMVAPNFLRDISVFGSKDTYSRKFEFLDNGDLSYWDSGAEEELIFKKDVIGEILWDSNKTFLDNELILLEDKERFRVEFDDYEWLGIYNRNENSGLDVNIDVPTDDVFNLLTGKQVITFSKEQLLEIKDKLLVCKEENIQCVNKIKEKIR